MSTVALIIEVVQTICWLIMASFAVLLWRNFRKYERTGDDDER